MGLPVTVDWGTTPGTLESSAEVSSLQTILVAVLMSQLIDLRPRPSMDPFPWASGSSPRAVELARAHNNVTSNYNIFRVWILGCTLPWSEKCLFVHPKQPTDFITKIWTRWNRTDWVPYCGLFTRVAKKRRVTPGVPFDVFANERTNQCFFVFFHYRHESIPMM